MTVTQLLCVIIFVVGFLVHSLKSAQEAVSKDGYKSIGYWFYVHWAPTVVRGAIASFAWVLYMSNQGLVTSALKMIGIDFTFALPVTKVTSFFVGYASDSLLDIIVSKVPWLEREIPMNEDGTPKDKVKDCK